MEVIKDADMLFLFLRFIHPDDASMAHFEAYLERGGPVLGLRTTTHGFNGLKGKYARYNYNNKDPQYEGGFGRQILGETWNPKKGAGHYGRNHKFSTRLHPVAAQTKHPILTGVKDMHTMAGAYSAVPMPGSIVLATNEVLESMKPDAEATPEQTSTACSLGANVHVEIGQDGTRILLDPRRIRRHLERRLPSLRRERDPLVPRDGERDQARPGHLLCRPLQPVDFQLQAECQGREARRHQRLGHADSQAEEVTASLLILV